MSEHLAALAADAYVYGFPLVSDLREVSRFTCGGMGSLAPAPFNTFSHGSALAGPDDRFVSVNNDTIYSVAQVDMASGPRHSRPRRPTRGYQRRFAPLGLLDPESPYQDCPPALATALAEGVDVAKQKIETSLKSDGLARLVSGWKLTYQVANPVNRYSIGDRTPGLRRDRDGSITITIQHAEPAGTSNWLPAPAGPFRPILRLYQPRPEVIDGTYQIPPIIRTAGPAAS